jgi:flavin reductase (DIM6/NTAB) family NADH-FMN oxidoreductase RutF
VTKPVGPAEFRELCGRFATGVVVVTAVGPDDQPAGMTANSLTSVSLDPPLVSIAVEHRAEFHAIIEATSQFTINVLATDQEAVSRRFATPSTTDRFAGIGYRTTESGRVYLVGVVAAIECETVHRLPVGDHTVVIGRVVGGEVHDRRPLLYFRGGYHALS